MTALPPDLWPHQRTAIGLVFAAYREAKRSILVSLPTGGGKTRVASVLIARYLAKQVEEAKP